MMKLIILALVVCLGCKMVLGKWPWEYLRGSSIRSQAVLKARKLLNVPAKASHTEIRAAHKRVLAMIHPDRGGTSAQVHEADAARDLLLDQSPHEVESRP